MTQSQLELSMRLWDTLTVHPRVLQLKTGATMGDETRLRAESDSFVAAEMCLFSTIANRRCVPNRAITSALDTNCQLEVW